MKSIILFLVLMMGAITSHAQVQSNLLLLQHFMRDIANPQIKESVIIDTYLCRYLHDVPNRKDNKNYLFAKGQITNMREYMQKEGITLEQLSMLKYKDIPVSDQNVSFGEKDDVYACYYEKKIFNFFLVKNNRIDAFNTLNKGSREVFVSHCQ